MYKYFVGDTKGWVEVRKDELGAANLLDLISTSSYEKGDYIYLDEDIDLSFFVYFLFMLSASPETVANAGGSAGTRTQGHLIKSQML